MTEMKTSIIDGFCWRADRGGTPLKMGLSPIFDASA